MKLPHNIELPLFTYGLFKPGQLCFPRIKDLVDNTYDAVVDGILKERDGIPLLVKNSYSRIKGVLVQFKDGYELEAYKRVIEIEPDQVYRWEEVVVSGNVNANALLGKRIKRGCSDLEYVEEWNGREDPYFKDALDEVETILKDNSQSKWDHKTLFRLQMAYFLLWTGLERYASLKYHLGKKVTTDKVYKIAEEETFAESIKKHVKSKREVYSSTDLKKYTLDPDNPDKSIRYYYQVRSNSVHRGKAVTRDFDIIRTSLEELLAIFKDLLNELWES